MQSDVLQVRLDFPNSYIASLVEGHFGIGLERSECLSDFDTNWKTVGEGNPLKGATSDHWTQPSTGVSFRGM